MTVFAPARSVLIRIKLDGLRMSWKSPLCWNTACSAPSVGVITVTKHGNLYVNNQGCVFNTTDMDWWREGSVDCDILGIYFFASVKLSGCCTDCTVSLISYSCSALLHATLPVTSQCQLVVEHRTLTGSNLERRHGVSWSAETVGRNKKWLSQVYEHSAGFVSWLCMSYAYIPIVCFMQTLMLRFDMEFMLGKTRKKEKKDSTVLCSRKKDCK